MQIGETQSVGTCRYLLLVKTVSYTSCILVLTRMSDGCSMRPVTLILPLTDKASSGLSVLIPTLPCNKWDNICNIHVHVYTYEQVYINSWYTHMVID